MEDPLTELPTGRAIAEALAEAIECSRGRTLAFYLLDLNGFKSVNNAYGSATGDAILRLIALRLRTVARRGDLIARYESDTFAVLAHDVVCRREAIDIGNRYVTTLDDPIAINSRAYAIGVTAGRGPAVALRAAGFLDESCISSRSCGSAALSAKRSQRK